MSRSPSIRRAGAVTGIVCGSVLTAGVLAAGPASAAASSQDATWLVAAHQSNLSEIAAGQAAQSGATTATVKSLGQMFITDHTKLDAQLKTLAQAKGVALPATPNAQQQASLQAVQANSGRAFDNAWIAAQLTGHAQAIAAGNTELASGSDAQVLAADRASAPTVAGHYAELKNAAAQYGVPVSVSAGTGGQAAHRPVSASLGTGLAGAGAVVLVGVGGGVVVLRRRRGQARASA